MADKQNELKEVPIDDWSEFAGEYLKADLVAEFPLVIVPVDVFGFSDGNKNRLSISFEYMRKTWKLELNKTAQQFIRQAGLKSPKALIGKKLTFDKIKTRNPSNNAMVDSFLLIKVE